MKINYTKNESYQITFTNNILSMNSTFFICIDKNVLNLHKNHLKNILNKATAVIEIEVSESRKNFNTLTRIIEMLEENNANRNHTIISIGGGITGDVCGFAASIYKRGINWINVPTTLLSMVDSSIGQKVGINFNNNKNLLGSFYAPKEVIIDQTFLKTLTTREFKSGLSELIKHGMIKDKKIIEELEKFDNIKSLKQTDLTNLLKMSLNVKKYYVEQDSNDFSIRNTLNFGHTFAHAIELENDLTHGECVAWGMLISTYETKIIYRSLKDLFEKFEILKPIKNLNLDNIINDKKTEEETINEVHLKAIGDAELRTIKISELIKKYKNNYQNICKDVKTNNIKYTFKKSVLRGNGELPPSKSFLHRYLIASALSNQKVELHNVNFICDDVLVTMKALKNLNAIAIYNSKAKTITVEPNKTSNSYINMGESASSLRIMLPVLMHYNNHLVIDGDNSLRKRPLNLYFDIFNNQDITYELETDLSLPLKVNGKIQPSNFILPGNVSSQFISGLLFLLPILNDDSTITITGKLESLDYIKMTIKTLNDFKINIEYDENYSYFMIKGNQRYCNQTSYIIEEDYSARSFFEVANTLGNSITLTTYNKNSLQGDKAIHEIIENDIKEVDLTHIPDLAPILSVYFTLNGGILKNTQRLTIKESNRLEAIIEFLTKMNIETKKFNNELRIYPGEINGNHFDTKNDHRIAMAIIIASTIASKKVTIDEIKSINKSFPNFISEYKKLGGDYDEE